jgi:tetratricopeptide (TPR) repeat protein
MKTIFFMLFISGLSLACFAQNDFDLPKTDVKVNEVTVSPPEFTGIPNYLESTRNGPDLIKRYLSENIVYPAKAAKCNSQGTELIKFTVTADGNLEDIKILNHVCPAIDKEMLRALKTTEGMWKPGIRDGQPVDMEYELFLTFALQSNSEEAKTAFLKEMQNHFKNGSKQMLLKQNFARAERCFDKAIVLWPFEPNTLMLRGLCRYEQGRTVEAVEDWERVKELTGIDFINEFEGEKYSHLKGYHEFLGLINEE